MKRKLVITSAVVLILALLATGTFAYFTKDARATNVITTGTIDITLNDEIRGGEKTGTGWKLESVMPGQAVEKKVSITNNGSAEAWLRVKLAVRVTVDGEEMPLTFGARASCSSPPATAGSPRTAAITTATPPRAATPRSSSSPACSSTPCCPTPTRAAPSPWTCWPRPCR